VTGPTLRVYTVKLTETLEHELRILASSPEHAIDRAIDQRCDDTVTGCPNLEAEIVGEPAPPAPGPDQVRPN